MKDPRSPSDQFHYLMSGCRDMKSTPAMRARVRELAESPRDDFDRAILAVLDDVEGPLRLALLDCQTLTPILLTGEQAIERLQEINRHVYRFFGQ